MGNSNEILRKIAEVINKGNPTESMRLLENSSSYSDILHLSTSTLSDFRGESTGHVIKNPKTGKFIFAPGGMVSKWLSDFRDVKEAMEGNVLFIALKSKEEGFMSIEALPTGIRNPSIAQIAGNNIANRLEKDLLEFINE